MMASEVRKKITKGGIYLILTIMAIQSVIPILWTIMASFNTGSSLYSVSLVPEKITFAHYQEIFNDRQYGKNFGLWYWNTFKIAILTMICATLLIIITSYALSQFRFKGRKFTLMTMLVVQMFPGFMSMFAIFILLLQLNLINTHMGLILVYAGGAIPGGVWLVKGYMDGLPRSLPEAAKIDGASNITIFLKVIMPISTPILTFIALQSFISPWMDFIFARLVLRSDDKKTLAIGLFEMVTGRTNTEFTMFAAGSVLVAIPITILFTYLQKYIVEGLSAGASKI
ncbi:MAG: sugar ABC transporter permease [Clostridia bacterium]|nr:sugar ABC transporter permease [Clostridia bacterium]